MQVRNAALGMLLLIPAAVAAAHVMASADAETAAGCDAVYQAPAGPIAIRVFLASENLRGAFDADALAAYLGDRTGRDVVVTATEVADLAAFEAYASRRAVWNEVLVRFEDGPRVEGITAADGTTSGLGYAQEDGACVRVAFVPTAGVPWTDAAGETHALQPAYTYLAHELGHVFGLHHTPQGIMGLGAYRPGQGDVFDAAQRAAFAA